MHSTMSQMTKSIGEILRDCDFNGKVDGDVIAGKLCGYDTIIDFLPETETAVIIDPDTETFKHQLTCSRLKAFILDEFDLSRFGLMRRDRVSVLIPNGSIVAVTIVALLHQWCVAPINPASTFIEIRDELLSTKSRCIIILKDDPAGKTALKAAEEVNIGVLILTPDTSTTGLFTIDLVRDIKMDSILNFSLIDNSVTSKGLETLSSQTKPQSEIVLLLHTSGTSGNKKLVPYSLDMIVVGVWCIIKSWNLSQSDVCLNMVCTYLFVILHANNDLLSIT